MASTSRTRLASVRSADSENDETPGPSSSDNAPQGRPRRSTSGQLPRRYQEEQQDHRTRVRIQQETTNIDRRRNTNQRQQHRNRAGETAPTAVETTTSSTTQPLSALHPSAEQIQAKYESDPRTAQLMFADQSGHDCQRLHCRYESEHTETSEQSEDRKPYHRGAISFGSRRRSVENYLNVMDPKTQIYTCASCGMFELLTKEEAQKAKYDKPLSSSEVSIVQLTNKRLSDYLYNPRRNNQNVVRVAKSAQRVPEHLEHIYIEAEIAQYQHLYPNANMHQVRNAALLRQDYKFYYLHEHLLIFDHNRRDFKVPVCETCRKSFTAKPRRTVSSSVPESGETTLEGEDHVQDETQEVQAESQPEIQGEDQPETQGVMPRFNIGNGYDFGRTSSNDEINIRDMTIAELMVCSPVIKYQICVKFKNTDQHGIRGNLISFEHSGRTVLATKLPRTDISDMLWTAFVGSEQTWDDIQGTKQKRKAFFECNPVLTINQDRVYRFLRLKMELDPNTYGHILIDNSMPTLLFLESLPDRLLDTALVSHDNSVINTERQETDRNVSEPQQSASPNADQLRDSQLSPTNEVRPEGSEPANESNLIAVMEPVFICDEVRAHVMNPAEVLQAVHQATTQATQTTAAPWSATNPVQIPVSQYPVNEITSNDVLLTGAFPHLFLLGEGVKLGSGHLTQREINHLIFQHDNRFVWESGFIFVLFNQLQRRQAILNSKARVHSDAEFIRSFTQLANEEDFQEQLQDAMNNPSAPNAKRIVNILTNTVRMSGGNIPWTQTERESAHSKMMALMLYAGPFSLFVTVSPCDVDSVLMLRLSRGLQPEDPSTPLDERDSEFEFILPSLNERHQTLAKNPMAAAIVYKRMIEAFFTHLVGLAPHYNMKLSHIPVVGRSDGLFGTPIVYAAVTEMQGRQSAHMHAVITTDLSPIVIRELIDNEEARRSLIERMDSILQAWLPPEAEAMSHMSSNFECKEPTPLIRDGRWRSLPCLKHRISVHGQAPLRLGENPTDEEFVRHLNACGHASAFKFNQHSHSPTCHKRESGRWRCRMALPKAAWDSSTDFLQLKMHIADDGTTTPVALERFESCDTRPTDPLRVWKDSRIIVLELTRPKEREQDHLDLDEQRTEKRTFGGQELDCYVDIGCGDNSVTVTFSPLLTAVLGCNTCIEPLGAALQSKAVTYYLLKYLTKDGGNLANLISLVKAADANIRKYPSTADDSGTVSRTSQHLLTRLLNSLNQQEYGGQTASLALLGMPSNIFSHEFTYCYIRSALKHTRTVYSQSVNDNSAADNEYDDEIDDIPATDAEIRDRELLLSREDNDDNEDEVITGTVAIATSSSGEVKTVEPFDHYRYRGEALADMSYYEYSGIVSIVPVRPPSQRSSQTPGRKPNPRFPFDSRHPEFGKREQMLRSKQTVPILAGRGPPRHPGDVQPSKSWRQKADSFAAYVITLHHPWNLETGTPTIPLNFDSLQSWVSTLADESNIDAVAKARVFWIRILSQGTSVSAEALKTISAWRNKYTKLWNKCERFVASQPECDRLNEFDDTGAGAIALKALEQAYASLQPDLQISDATKKAQETVQYLNDCFHDAPTISTAGNGRRDEAYADEINEVHSRACTVPDASESPSTELIDEDTHPELSTGRGLPLLNVDSGPFHVNEEADDDLNYDQNCALMRACMWYNDYSDFLQNPVGTCPDELRLLILGAAGTGKSYFVRKLVERLGSDAVVCAAPTGIAASGLPQGQTLHSLFALSVRKDTATSSVASQTAGKARCFKARLLIIDEVSMLTDETLGNIAKRLSQWFPGRGEFGGLGVIMMGDFFQLPAVGKSLLQASAEPTNAVGRLFKTFQRVNFTEQMRAAEDVEHARCLEAFRCPSMSLQPVVQSAILKRLVVLKPLHCETDSKWMHAKVIVTDNNKRLAINQARAIAFARSTGQPVIAWIHKLGDQLKQNLTNVAMLNECSWHELARAHPELVSFFVTGAPAIISENVAVLNGLTNGTTCKYHSLTLDAKESDLDAEWSRIESTEPGQLVWLSNIPKSVNVELPMTSGWTPSQSLSEQSFVVPLLVSRHATKFEATTVKRVKSRMGTKGSSNMQYYDFGVELAFSLTYHKVQGQTLPAVILDLNGISNCRMTVAAFYVGVSRVKASEDIRILPIDARTRVHLEKLEFGSTLVKWYDEQDDAFTDTILTD